MKKTNSKRNIAKAKRLYELSKKLKELNEEQDKLKAFFKGKIGKEMVLQAGDVVINLDERSRLNFDAETLAEDKGVEFVAKYQYTTVYEVITVSKKK